MNDNLKQYLARVTQSLEAASLEWVSRRVRINSNEHDAVECVTSRSPLCLLGDPGSGKTTVLKMAAVYVSHSSQGSGVVPFFISAASAPDVHMHVAEWVATAVRMDVSIDFVEPLLKRGQALILIDGLDELPYDRRDYTIHRISRWLVEFPTNRWVLSSRPIGFSGLPKFVEVGQLMDLSAAEIEDVTRRLLLEKHYQAAELANAITTQRDLASLATSPFLLSLLVEIYRHDHRIPTARADLYGSWTDIALRQWDKSRGIGRRIDYLSLEATRQGLEILALNLSVAKRAHFELTEWFAAITTLLGAGDDVWSKAEITFSENVLGSGLVREISAMGFTFAHLTLQEYFAALAIQRMEISDALRHLEQVPREVAAFYAETTNDTMEAARFFIKQGRFDDVRRLVTASPHLPKTEREEIVTLMAEQLGVNEIAFLQPIVDESCSEHSVDDKNKLRELWRQCHGDLTSQEKGKRFEEFAESLFGLVFEVVEVRRLTTFGEIDIICEVKADSFWIRWPGDCFIECKNYGEKVSVSIANEFIGKCSTIRVRLAFLVSAGPLTGPSRERVSRSWSQADVPDMAWLDGEDIEKWLENDVDAERLLKDVVRRASYGVQ